MVSRWFANLVLIGGAVLSITAGLMACSTARDYHAGLLRQAAFAAGPILLAAALLLCLRLSIGTRVAVAMTLLSLVVAAYAAEAYLRLLPTLRVRLAAGKFGIPYDGRSQFEVVRDLRSRGEDAWPAVFPAWQGLQFREAGPLPLGGISGVTTVFCNEMGRHVVYVSDEHGFHNPKGLWASRALDVAVLGDSFTQGVCVPSEENFVALIRGKYAATVNLGMLGNGPLLMLAGLKELLVNLKPRVVLWVYTEGNDLVSDLDRETRDPRLLGYLRSGDRQGLLERQSEVDALLRGIVDREYAARQNATILDSVPPRFWRLWSLRAALGLQVEESHSVSAHPDAILFREILEAAQRATREWGGALWLVYLPAEARYFENKLRHSYDPSRAEVLAIASDLGIPLIDLHPAIARHPDIPELYAFRGGHFSPAGNRLVAETILRALPDFTAN